MKILGMVLGALTCLITGFSLRGELKRKLSDLDCLILEMEELKKGVLIYKKPLSEILKKLTLPPFKGEDTGKNAGYKEAKECVFNISRCNMSNEDAIISESIRKIRILREDAENELRTKGLMYIKLSVLVALLFIVIVI